MVSFDDSDKDGENADVEVKIYQALTMIDKLITFKDLNREEKELLRPHFHTKA